MKEQQRASGRFGLWQVSGTVALGIASLLLCCFRAVPAAQAGTVPFTPPTVGQALVASVLGEGPCYCVSIGQFSLTAARVGEPCPTCIPVLTYPYYVGDTICLHAHAQLSYTICGDECTDCYTIDDGAPRFWRWRVYHDDGQEPIYQFCTYPNQSPGQDYDINYLCMQPGSYTFVLTCSALGGDPADPDEICGEPTLVMCDSSPCPCQAGPLSRSFSVNVQEPPVRYISFDKDHLMPDGKSTATARLENCIGTPITWSLVGDTRGARISSSTGVITAGKQCGWITVRATEAGRITDDPACEQFIFERPFRIDCSACGSGGCSPGKEEVRSGAADATFSLGACDANDSAGKLWIYEPKVTWLVGTPMKLHYDAGDCSGVQVIVADGVIRQVLAPQTLAQVTVIGQPSAAMAAYEIAFYLRKDVIVDTPHNPDIPYELDPDAVPSVTWRIQFYDSYPDDPGGEQLLILKLPGGAQNPTQQYEYNGGALSQGDGASTLRNETVDWDPVNLIRTTSVFTGGADNAVDYRQDHFAEFPWGQSITQTIVGDSSDCPSPQVANYSYYYDGEGRVGQVKSVVNSDGSWKWYDYDLCGNVSVEASPWLDSALPADNDPNSLSTSRAIYYSYESLDQRDVPNDENATFPRTVTEKIRGIIAGTTYYAYYADEDGRKVELVEHSARQNGWYGDALNLRTVTTYVAGDDKKIYSIRYPDQRLDSYSYETGTIAYTGGDPDGAFVPGSGDFLRRTIIHGTVQSPSGVAGKSTMEKTVINAFGVTVVEETYAYDGTTYERIDWTAYVLDDFGHATDTYKSDGTHGSTVWGCCYPESATDATGIQTTFHYDALGRLDQSVKLGVNNPPYPPQVDLTTTYGYDGSSRLLTTTTTAGGLTLTSGRTYDTAGRLLTNTDQAGLTTSYEYTTAGNGWQVAAKLLNAPTTTTLYYPDGRVKSLAGPAVVNQHYTYGIDADGRQWAQTNTAAADSPRYVKVWNDILGRQVREQRPGYPNDTIWIDRYYDAKGRLVRTETSRPAAVQLVPDQLPVDGQRVASGDGTSSLSRAGGGGPAPIGPTPLGAVILYEYDEMGDLIRTGSDLDGNGALDIASSDRINETSTSYVNDAGTWWLETASKVYATNFDSTPTTTDRSRQKLTGLVWPVVRHSESHDVYGNVTTTETTLAPANKLVTETMDTPSSDTNAVTVTQNSLVQSTTSDTGLTYLYGYDALARQTTTTDPRTGVSEVHYHPDTGRVDWRKDAHEDQTNYYYYGNGRLDYVTNPGNNSTHYGYNTRGQVTSIWGEATYRVGFEYNDYGERTKLTTRRGQFTLDDTVWAYHEATGLLESKTYEDGKAVTYTYTSGGKLETRTWARQVNGQPLTTTYQYDDLTGELTRIDYSDGTPHVGFFYNRLGSVSVIEDAWGARTFTYDGSLQLRSENLMGLLYKTLTYEHETAPGVAGRLAALKVGLGEGADEDYLGQYFYDAQGRLNRVSGPGLPAYGAVYGRLPNSELIERIDLRSDQTTTLASTARGFEGQRDLLAAVENRWVPGGPGEPLVSKYAYVNDNLARRTSVLRTGSAFAGGSGDHFDLYGYNDRNELTISRRFVGATLPDPLPDPQTPGLDPSFGYDYDWIGNRMSHTVCGIEYCPPEGGEVTSYTRNGLNQYTATSNPSEIFGYDADGNLTADGTFAYTWDAENRLADVRPTAPVLGVSAHQNHY